MKTQSVYRCDISTLRPVERRADGTIVVDAFLTKCGVFQYVLPDGSIRRELRLHEDVADPESLRSFEGRPVTNNHPPGMISAKNARNFAVGAVVGTPAMDGDHVRSRLSVFDADAVEAMEAGKLQVSNGYVCDCEEKSGIHPMYGAYDAIQHNIRGNHVAIVDRARAGVTASARMDGSPVEPWQVGMMVVEPGSEVVLTPGGASGMNLAMALAAPSARIEVVVKHDDASSASAKVDPEDLASRNAAGKTSAKSSKKKQPGDNYEDDGNDRSKPNTGSPDDDDDREDRGGDTVRGADKDPDADDSDDDEDDAEDAMYDGDGKLTKAGDAKIAAHTFAVPGKKQLPMHSPDAVKDSMKFFPKHPFDDADQKHGAFNRLKGKALAFGMKDDASRFETKHGGKLDRADGANKEDAMSTQDMQGLQAKADKRKEKLVKARTRIDALETELAEKDALIENMKRDAAATPKKDATDAPRLDDAEIQKRVDSKVELLDKARQSGATVESKMSPTEIMRATIKHVDGEDVPEPKKDDASYVQALFDGACKRAKKDAADVEKGSSALAAARAAVETGRANTNLDGDTDEDAAKAKLRSANRELINQPSAARRQSARA